jgi:hypothetical protein
MSIHGCYLISPRLNWGLVFLIVYGINHYDFCLPILFIFGSLRVLWANEVGPLTFNGNDEIDVLSFKK